MLRLRRRKVRGIVGLRIKRLCRGSLRCTIIANDGKKLADGSAGWTALTLLIAFDTSNMFECMDSLWRVSLNICIAAFDYLNIN